MSERNDVTASDSRIEQILSNAPPRPAPSKQDAAIVRDAVRSEWRTVSRRRRNRRRIVSFATAASLILAIAVGAFLLQMPSAIPVQVAFIEKSTGSIYLVGEQSQLRRTTNLTELHAGQTIGTGQDSRVSLDLIGGGSLRVDEGSRVDLTSAEEIFLRQGRVYFDSQPTRTQSGIAGKSSSNFAIRTEHGLVRHLGTQYMAGVSRSGITVVVRAGEVAVSGTYFDAKAAAGQQVVLDGTNKPSYASVGTHGALWHWAETMAPTFEVDDPMAAEFISWVARETGLRIHFTNDVARQRASDVRLFGVASLELEPRAALRSLLETTTLDARIEDGMIVISER